jgi:hypothetical protein
MNSKTNTPRLIALVAVFVIVIIFGGWAMSREISNSGITESGWGELSWMLIPAIIALGLGDVLGISIFRKKWWPGSNIVSTTMTNKQIQ